MCEGTQYIIIILILAINSYLNSYSSFLLAFPYKNLTCAIDIIFKIDRRRCIGIQLLKQTIPRLARHTTFPFLSCFYSYTLPGRAGLLGRACYTRWLPSQGGMLFISYNLVTTVMTFLSINVRIPTSFNEFVKFNI